MKSVLCLLPPFPSLGLSIEYLFGLIYDILCRDPTGAPPIPAGIAQATQPIFVSTPFKNSFLSPQLQFVHNSKLSPTLQQIREQSAGIVTSF